MDYRAVTSYHRSLTVMPLVGCHELDPGLEHYRELVAGAQSLNVVSHQVRQPSSSRSRF
jgi:hypothetical protein